MPRDELMHTEESEDPSNRYRDLAPTQVAESSRIVEFDRLSARLHLAVPGGDDVADKIRVGVSDLRQGVAYWAPREIGRS